MLNGTKSKKTPWFAVKSRRLAPPARLELTTLRLGGVRSIQVSYGGMSMKLAEGNNRLRLFEGAGSAADGAAGFAGKHTEVLYRKKLCLSINCGTFFSSKRIYCPVSVFMRRREKYVEYRRRECGPGWSDFWSRRGETQRAMKAHRAFAWCFSFCPKNAQHPLYMENNLGYNSKEYACLTFYEMRE